MKHSIENSREPGFPDLDKCWVPLSRFILYWQRRFQSAFFRCYVFLASNILIRPAVTGKPVERSATLGGHERCIARCGLTDVAVSDGGRLWHACRSAAAQPEFA